MKSIRSCVVALAVGFLACNAVSASLVAHWSFDSDFTANNSAYDAAAVNGTTIVTGGKIRGAANFDRSQSQYLTAASPFGTGSYTYTAWYYLDVAPITNSSRYFVLESTNDNNLVYPASYGLRKGGTGVDANGEVYTHTDASVKSMAFNGNGNKQWHHIAVTYDASTGLFKAYLDGTLADSMTQTGTLSATTKLVIGGHRSGAGRNFEGLIDDVAVFNNVVSEDYISYLAAGNPVPEPTMLMLLAMGSLSLLRSRRKK